VYKNGAQFLLHSTFMKIKLVFSEVSLRPLCKDGNAVFTMLSLKLRLSDQV